MRHITCALLLFAVMSAACEGGSPARASVSPEQTSAFEIKPVPPWTTAGNGRATLTSDGDLVLDVAVRGAEISRSSPPSSQRANLIWHLLEGTCAAWTRQEPGHNVIARWTKDPQQVDAQDFRYVIRKSELDSMTRPHALGAFRNGGALPLYACGDIASFEPAAQTGVSRSAAPAPSREPATLPELPWEREIVEGLRREGIALTLIGGSKFEAELGPRLPARVFIVRAGAGGEGADVLLLDRAMREITVCALQKDPPTSYWSYTVSVDGRVVWRGEGTQHVLHSVSDRFFVVAIGERFDAAIRRVLGTTRPRC
jgi:hypothetical protein